MAYSAIAKPTDYFNTVLYTGNGTDNHAITGVGFQPDFIWIKARSSAKEHRLQNAVSGITNHMRSNATNAESAGSVKTADSDGFTLGTGASWNENSTTYASWNWLAANGTASNTDGSITSTVSASTTAGFSIVSYTGTGSVATVGHGLGVAPKFIIVKTRSLSGEAWPVDIREQTGIVYLNETGSKGSYGDSSPFPSTAPTTTVFSIGTPNNTNGSGATYIAYCFAEVKGFSKFGKYTGNGNSDGAFAYTGFRPAFVMIKSSSASSTNWNIYDNKRDGFNGSNENLSANLTDAESSGNNRIDILSNGFKVRASTADVGTSSATYIYMAFAENPFVANDSGTAVPVVAR